MRRGIWIIYFILVYSIAERKCADYRIDVTTVDKQEAGPNSVTYITLEGSLGHLDRVKLPTGVKKARLDTLDLDDTNDVGTVCRVNLASGSDDSWFVGTVFVRINDVNERSQLFIFNQWLTDHSIIHRYFKVHGGWSRWSKWGECSTCGVTGIESRNRTCDSPIAGCGGEPCRGDMVQTRPCVVTCGSGDTPRTGESLQESDLLPWILGLVGCCLVILLLVILLIVMCCLYNKQKKQREMAEYSPYTTGHHTKIHSQPISFMSSPPHDRSNLSKRPSSTYGGSISTLDHDSGIIVKSLDEPIYGHGHGDHINGGTQNLDEDDPNYNEQNNCVDYVYYTYNYNRKNADANGKSPMFVPVGDNTGTKKPSTWDVNDMYETNITVL